MVNRAQASHLVLWAGDALLGVPVAAVQEIQSLPTITPLPGQPLFIKGLSLLNDEVVPVIDLIRAMHLPTATEHTGPEDRRPRLVILREGDRRLGLETKRVLGFFDLEDQTLGASGALDELIPELLPISEKASQVGEGWIAISSFPKLFAYLQDATDA